MILWVVFILFILGMLALDLGVFHKKAHVIGTREALLWTAFWIILAMGFNIGVYFFYEHHWFDLGKKIGFDFCRSSRYGKTCFAIDTYP